MSSATTLGQDIVARFLLPKLETKLAKLRREIRRFEWDMLTARWTLADFLEEIGVLTPEVATVSILQEPRAEVETIERVLIHMEFDTGHVGMEMIAHLPRIKSLVDTVWSIKELRSDASALHDKISDLLQSTAMQSRRWANPQARRL